MPTTPRPRHPLPRSHPPHGSTPQRPRRARVSARHHDAHARTPQHTTSCAEHATAHTTWCSGRRHSAPTPVPARTTARHSAQRARVYTRHHTTAPVHAPTHGTTAAHAHARTHDSTPQRTPRARVYTRHHATTSVPELARTHSHHGAQRVLSPMCALSPFRAHNARHGTRSPCSRPGAGARGQGTPPRTHGTRAQGIPSHAGPRAPGPGVRPGVALMRGCRGGAWVRVAGRTGAG